MIQCKLHQTSWIDQGFSGGECAECTKERRERIQHINKLAAENRELRERLDGKVAIDTWLAKSLLEDKAPMESVGEKVGGKQVTRCRGCNHGWSEPELEGHASWCQYVALRSALSIKPAEEPKDV